MQRAGDELSVVNNNRKMLGEGRQEGHTPLLVDVPLFPTCPTTWVGSPILMIDTTVMD